MDRRRFLLTSLAGALGVLVAPVLGGAQGTRKAPRVGVVLAATQALGQPSTEAFRAGLRDLGYLEGQSIAIEVRWAEGNPERFPDLIADLLRANVDVLVVVGANAALAAKKAATTTPVVFVAVTDPVGTGVVESLARPGGNITGVSMALGEGFAGKWVQHLKDALPRVSSVAALVEASHPLKTTWAREMGAASRAPEIKLQVLEVHPNVDALQKAASAMIRTPYCPALTRGTLERKPPALSPGRHWQPPRSPAQENQPQEQEHDECHHDEHDEQNDVGPGAFHHCPF